MKESLQVSYLGRLQLGEGDRQSAAFPDKNRETRFRESDGERRSGTARRAWRVLYRQKSRAGGGAGIQLAGHVNWISRDGDGVGLWS